VVNADIGWLKDPYPGEEFDLGFSFGPRGFPAHAFTGDRAFFATAEYRYVIIENLGGLVAIGAAGFADYGGAWYSGSPRRSGTDVGVGLRLGSTRSSSGGAAARIDFARRFANDVLPAGWVLAVGTGFAFDRPR
jgi:hemolysin activation/secretion protein